MVPRLNVASVVVTVVELELLLKFEALIDVLKFSKVMLAEAAVVVPVFVCVPVDTVLLVCPSVDVKVPFRFRAVVVKFWLVEVFAFRVPVDCVSVPDMLICYPLNVKLTF